MRLESVLFASKNPQLYDRLARVLELSALENTAAPLRVRRVEDRDEDIRLFARRGCKQAWLDNARKARHQCQLIKDAKDGELLGMIDADAMILSDLSEIEAFEFDLAYTVRPPGNKWKINTGVYFVRVSERTRILADGWERHVMTMLADRQLHDKWRKQMAFGGIHQAALGYWLDLNQKPTEFIRALPLPCETWNCVPSVVDLASEPKVVHIMGQMREWCLDHSKPKSQNAKRFTRLWREYDLRAAAVPVS